jgi:hypothetical protein
MVHGGIRSGYEGDRLGDDGRGRRENFGGGRARGGSAANCGIENSQSTPSSKRDVLHPATPFLIINVIRCGGAWSRHVLQTATGEPARPWITEWQDDCAHPMLISARACAPSAPALDHLLTLSSTGTLSAHEAARELRREMSCHSRECSVSIRRSS